MVPGLDTLISWNSSLEPETAHRPVRCGWLRFYLRSLTCRGARPPVSPRAMALSLSWGMGPTVEVVNTTQASGSALGPHLLCAAAMGAAGGLPAAPSLWGPCRAPQGAGPGGVCGRVSSPGPAAQVGPSASGRLPPMRGAGGLGTAPEEGSDGLTLVRMLGALATPHRSSKPQFLCL